MEDVYFGGKNSLGGGEVFVNYVKLLLVQSNREENNEVIMIKTLAF